MAIILKANKVKLFVSSVLFVFWYHSPNFLDTPRICHFSVDVVVVYAWQLQVVMGGERKASTFSFYATLLAASDNLVLSLYCGPYTGASRQVVH
jgi:hypothetical protein